MTNFNNTLEDVRARIDIVDIISDHVALKKSGRNWTGLCPFHPEKTPSFMVNKEKNIFKCFGCGAGGDAFAFLQRIGNKEFSEVLTDLAERYGIKITYSKENTDQKNQIIEINKLAAKYFTENLFDKKIGNHAKEYLNNRGISDETIFQFNIGYAPEGWDNLLKHLSKNHSVSNDLMETAGLITKRAQSEGCYDRFRDRVIIPIHNDRGQIIAFGGRSLSDDNQPKYLNSPETPVFYKGKNIYSLYQAKETIRSEDSVILVEGYFDAITAHTNGITNVVATLGTALTSDQLRLLGKYTESKRIYIAFDADLAGGSATSRGIEVIKNTFGGLGGIKILDNKYSKHSIYEIRVISIPEGKDPDEFIRTKGADIFKRLVKNAPLLLDFQIDQVLGSNDLESINGKVKAAKELAAIFSEISSPIVRSEYVRLVSERISVKEEDLLMELNQLKPGSKARSLDNQRSIQQTGHRKEPKDFIQLAEQNLLSLFFLKDELWDSVASKLKEVEFLDKNHQSIKASIDELIRECGSVDELTHNILEKFTADNEATEILSGILFNLDDKYCLNNNNSIDLFIKENLACITRFKAQNTENDIKQKYHELQNDEIKSLELQYKVRQLVNSRLSAL